MTLRARTDKAVEIGILNGSSPEHAFFRGPLASLVDFIRVGIEHILLGPDHLLFLLTVVIAGANWRYWAAVITTFTVAHSFTLGLAVFGLVRVSPHLVEPAIAASIVLMAADNLIRRERVGRERVALVLACGLLHGLGFASALGEIGVDPMHRVATLAGFNIGVEIGQVMFVGGVLGVTYLVRRWAGLRALHLWPTAVSGFAVIAGVVMVIDRFHLLLATSG
jgi:hydrogenase/urease accessory protein HupE